MPIADKSHTLIPRIGQVWLGTPKGNNSPGRNQPHFRVESEYLPPTHLAEVLGEKPTELTIYFKRFFEDEKRSYDFIFNAGYKAFANGRWLCSGDGTTALRNTTEGPVERSCTCELLTGPTPSCKQQGELRMVLEGLPNSGYFQMVTHSWKGISNIQSAISLFYSYLGANFWNARFILSKRMESTGAGKRNYVVGLRLHPDYCKLSPALAEQSFSLESETEEHPDTASHHPVNEMGPYPEQPLPEEEDTSVSNRP